MIASQLMQRWNKARGILEISSEKLSVLSSNSPGMSLHFCHMQVLHPRMIGVFSLLVLISEDLIERWIETEKSIVCFSSERKRGFLWTTGYDLDMCLTCWYILVTEDWKPHYLLMLQSYYTARYYVMTCTHNNVRRKIVMYIHTMLY